MKTYPRWLCIALAVALFPMLTRAQNLFVSCQDGNIYEFSTNGVQSTFATGLGQPAGVAFDSAGNLFVAGYQGTVAGSNYIYKFTPDGSRSIVAFASATTAHFSGLATGSTGNLFVADETSPGHIYEFTTNGTQSVFAAGLNSPRDLAFDRMGNLFVQDSSGAGGTIYEFTPEGTQSTFVSGTGSGSYLAFDGAGNLFVAAGGTGNIYEFTTNRVQTTFANGYGPMAFDRMNNLFVAGSVLLDGFTSNYIYEFAPDGTRGTFASLPSKVPFIAIQPAPTPLLNIAQVGNQTALFWPAWATNYVLECTTNLSGTNWTAVTNGTPIVGVILTNTVPVRFFRLRQN